MRTLRFASLLTVAALCVVASIAQSTCSHRRFFAGDEDPCFDAAPAPSQIVLSAILSTNEAREAVEDMKSADRSNVSKLLKGLIVHLRSEQQEDMIVRGDFPMSGVDNSWFWVITSAQSHPSATWVQGNAVTILRSRHNGYADIRTDWSAGSHRATRVFRYDGHGYHLFREKYEDVPPA